jgi:ABC-type dipeptide/oligopeptide/nickel transport system permease component
MLTYFVKRIVVMVLMIFLIATMIFLMFRLMPGNPTAFVIDPSLSQESRELLMDRYGLNDSLWVQYQIFMKDLVQLDFGNSFFYNKPAVEVIADKFLPTIFLMLTAMIIAYTFGIVFGVLMAWKRGTFLESLGISISLFFRSAPTFWVGLIAIIVFAVQLRWVPAFGMRTVGTGGGTFSEMYLNMDFVRHLILPSLVAAFYFIATPLLIMRNSMLEVMSEDYIEMAKAKGIRKFRILYRHAARNALLPVVTAGALFIGAAIGGQVLIEVVFNWPGLGREIVTAVTRHDYPLAQAIFIIISALIMFMNLVADILYAWLDPRITY